MLNLIRRKTLSLVQTIQYRWQLYQHAKHLPPISAEERKIVETCRQEGVCITSLQQLNLAATAQMLRVANLYLSKMEAIRSAEQSQGEQLGTIDSPAYPQIFTVTHLPAFANWGCDPRLLNIIENYIGLPVEFQGVHLRRDFANKRPVTTELWHKDMEDRRVIKVFVCLKDVTMAHGPYEYIPKSQANWFTMLRIYWSIYQRKKAANPVMGLTDREMANIVPATRWQNCAGPAGTVVLSDTVAVFHHGKSRQADRSTLFFVYTAKQPLRPQDCTQYRDNSFPQPEPILS